MKLSKTTTIAITSASAVIYGFGVVVAQVSAQSNDIVSPEVSAQIQEALGNPDSDELIVDALTQVESQLREYKVSSFAPDENDPTDVTELKLMRRQYIQELRQRMQQLDGTERGEFRQKIQARRKEVRREVFEIRKTRFEEKRNAKLEEVSAKQEELESRRTKFKSNLEARIQAAKDRARTPEEKLADRVETTIERREREATFSAIQKGFRDKIESRERQKVKGAIDYQPANILEKIGYWLFGN